MENKIIEGVTHNILMIQGFGMMLDSIMKTIKLEEIKQELRLCAKSQKIDYEEFQRALIERIDKEIREEGS